MFKKLQNKRNSHLYEEWFLNYKPYDFPLSVREKIKKTPSYVMSIKKYSKLRYKKEQPQYKEEQEKDTKKEEGNFILNIFNKEHNETSNKNNKNNKTQKKKKREKKSLISILKKNKTKKNKSVKFNI
jgi:hypothetical protein